MWSSLSYIHPLGFIQSFVWILFLPAGLFPHRLQPWTVWIARSFGLSDGPRQWRSLQFHTMAKTDATADDDVHAFTEAEEQEEKEALGRCVKLPPSWMVGNWRR